MFIIIKKKIISAYERRIDKRTMRMKERMRRKGRKRHDEMLKVRIGG